MTEPITPSTASVPGLAEVLERLDRLEVALRELIQVTASRPSIPEPAPATRPLSGNAAPGEPPLIRVAPPQGRGTEPPITRVAPPQAGPGAEPTRAPVVDEVRTYVPYADRTDIEPPPPNATIQQVLTRVFEAGLMPEPEDTWVLMAKLTHPSQMQGPRALDHFKAFTWPKLRRAVSSYLRNNDPSTFVVAYTDPTEITATDERVRLFLKVDDRMPVPIGFARDKTQNNAWRVTMMSL